MSVEFTAHNIRLDNGTFTKPENGSDMTSDQWFVSARALLNSLFPGDKSRYRLVDLGCLEGGYAVEFARLGFQVTGVEVRESNMAACRYVKANTSLPNLNFVQDDAWNLSKYGRFDVVFCCGLFYHLDRPKQFLAMLAESTNHVLILQTHFAVLSDTDTYVPIRPAILGKILRPIAGGAVMVQQERGQTKTTSEKFGLSALTENEGLRGRWYTEFASDDQFQQREANKWASWDNRRSFWVLREDLLQAILQTGFDVVLEQYDSLGPELANSMIQGYYKTDTRGTFVGIKSKSFG